jgi:hypothetical protein
VATLKRGEGAYGTAAVSGLITGVVAGSATNGHLFAFRFAPPTAQPAPKYALIQRVRARAFTIDGYTAAQEVGIDLVVARSYTVGHTSGTALTLTGNNAKKITAPCPTIQGATLRIATTGQLTAGTHTLDAQPLRFAAYAELAAAATVPKGAYEIFMSTEDLDRYPLALAANEGFIIRNTVAQGAAGTVRLDVEVDWLELLRVA